MAFLNNDSASPTVTVKLTNAGRKLIANGFKLDNIFDITKFSFGDSEIDYGIAVALTEVQELLEPEVSIVDFTSKLYASGIEPIGVANVSLTTNELNLTTFQNGLGVGATTVWPPVEGVYVESYKWTNLGPLQDYDFKMIPSIDTKSATFGSFGVIGSTTIKVEGKTSGKFSLVTINIT